MLSNGLDSDIHMARKSDLVAAVFGYFQIIEQACWLYRIFSEMTADFIDSLIQFFHFLIAYRIIHVKQIDGAGYIVWYQMIGADTDGPYWCRPFIFGQQVADNGIRKKW